MALAGGAHLLEGGQTRLCQGQEPHFELVGEPRLRGDGLAVAGVAVLADFHLVRHRRQRETASGRAAALAVEQQLGILGHHDQRQFALQGFKREGDRALLPGGHLQRGRGRRVPRLEDAHTVALAGARGQLQRRLAHVDAVQRDARPGRRRGHAHQAVGGFQGDLGQCARFAGDHAQDVGPPPVAGEFHGNPPFPGDDGHRPRRDHAGRLVVHQNGGARRHRGNGDVAPVRREAHRHCLRAFHPLHVELDGGRLVAGAGDVRDLLSRRQARLQRGRAAGVVVADHVHAGARRIHVERHLARQPPQHQGDGLIGRLAHLHVPFQIEIAGGAGQCPVAPLPEQMGVAHAKGEAAFYRQRGGRRGAFETNGLGGEQEPKEPGDGQTDGERTDEGDAARREQRETPARLCRGGLETRRLDAFAGRRSVLRARHDRDRRQVAHAPWRSDSALAGGRVRCVPNSGCPPGPCSARGRSPCARRGSRRGCRR